MKGTALLQITLQTNLSRSILDRIKEEIPGCEEFHTVGEYDIMLETPIHSLDISETSLILENALVLDTIILSNSPNVIYILLLNSELEMLCSVQYFSSEIIFLYNSMIYPDMTACLDLQIIIFFL